MKNIVKQIIFLTCFICVIAVPYFVFAETDALKGLEQVGETSGPYTAVNDQNNINTTIGRVISIGLSMLGIIFIILIIYAGFNWMTAQGDEEKVNKAKNTLKTAIIGLIIVVLAYAIYQFIILKLLFG